MKTNLDLAQLLVHKAESDLANVHRRLDTSPHRESRVNHDFLPIVPPRPQIPNVAVKRT